MPVRVYESIMPLFLAGGNPRQLDIRQFCEDIGAVLMKTVWEVSSMVEVTRLGVIMGPDPGFGRYARFNPGVYWDGSQMHVLYRASDSTISDKTTYATTIGHARVLLDGTIIADSNGPVIQPESPEERMGCEDARIVGLDDRLLVFYTAFSGETTRVVVASTEGFSGYQRLGLIDNGYRDKDAFVFPERIGKRIAYVHRVEPGIQIEFVDEVDELFEGAFWHGYAEHVEERTVLRPEQPWEAVKIGGGAPPIRTAAGWLLIYHGVSEERRYSAGAALLDIENPRVCLARLPYPLLEPQEEYERVGDVPNVVFPEGAFVHDGVLYIVYGAADTRIGFASVSVSDLLSELDRYRR